MKNRFPRNLIALSTLCLFALLTPLAVLHAQVTTGTPYNIINENSGLCVGASGQGTANGTVLQMNTCANGTFSTQLSQEWIFTAASSGYYEIADANATTEAWNVVSKGTTNGSKMQIWTYAAGTNEEFSAVSLGSGYYKFVGQGSGLCLDVPSNSKTAGTQLDIYTCNGTTAQAFKISAPTVSSCTSLPSVPANLAASGTTGTTTNLSWTASTATSPCAVTGYTVYENSAALATVTGTSYAVSGLAPSTTYSYTVAATDSDGTSAKSSTVSVTTASSGSGEGPYGGTAAAIPGTVMAENYDTGGSGVGYSVASVNGSANTYRSDGVDLEAATSPATGDDLGWSASGQWFRYTVNVSTAGTYTVSFLVAAESAISDAFHLSSSSGTNLSGSVAVPNTAGWQTWTTVTATVTLPAGIQTLTLNEDNSGWNFDSMAFTTGGGGGGGTGPRLVGYLPDYDASYATYAKSLSFNKMTHLNFAFGNPPTCSGTCTASSNMTFSLGQTDANIATLVNAAHAAGVKVILSIGGGGGDKQIIQFYKAGLSTQLIASLNNYVTAHNLDGVDLDIEDPSNMGTPYATFVADLLSTFHPQNKLVTAAVAEYLMANSSQPNGMPVSTLNQFDFVNDMVYSNLSTGQAELAWFTSQGLPASKITLGVPFFGQSSDGNTEENYSTILAAYPSAGSKNQVSGGSLDNGIALNYVGNAEMAQETQLGVQYGGVMIWDLGADAPAPNSLLTVVQNNM